MCLVGVHECNFADTHLGKESEAFIETSLGMVRNHFTYTTTVRTVSALLF